MGTVCSNPWHTLGCLPHSPSLYVTGYFSLQADRQDGGYQGCCQGGREAAGPRREGGGQQEGGAQGPAEEAAGRACEQCWGCEASDCGCERLSSACCFGRSNEEGKCMTIKKDKRHFRRGGVAVGSTAGRVMF